MNGYQFDNEKQKKTLKKLLKRLSKGSINDAQAYRFMKNHSDYTDERSYENFLSTVKSSSKIPVKKKGSELVRTDI